MRKDLRTGYSSGMVALVAAADQSLVAIQFAQHCIKSGVPARVVARRMGVSKATVYNWFKGEFAPTAAHEAKMRDWLSRPAVGI